MIREWGQPGDLGWVIKAHGEMYATELGFNHHFEALAAQIVADFAAKHDPERETAWIAETGGRRVGSVFCVDGHDGAAVLRLLLLDPAARGHGLGGELVDTCLGFARRSGYDRIRLWTVDVLAAARAIYLRRGFRLIDRRPYRDFGPDLIAETYELDLA